MKKENIYKFLYAISILLVAAFVIVSAVDTYMYCGGYYLGSAPLYAYILLNAVAYLLPSLAFFAVGIICKKRFVEKWLDKEHRRGGAFFV